MPCAVGTGSVSQGCRAWQLPPRNLAGAYSTSGIQHVTTTGRPSNDDAEAAYYNDPCTTSDCCSDKVAVRFQGFAYHYCGCNTAVMPAPRLEARSLATCSSAAALSLKGLAQAAQQPAATVAGAEWNFASAEASTGHRSPLIANLPPQSRCDRPQGSIVPLPARGAPQIFLPATPSHSRLYVSPSNNTLLFPRDCI